MLELGWLAPLLTLLTGALASVLPVLVGRFRKQPGDGILTTSEFRKRRIERLTGALQDADLLLGEIESEIQLGHQRAEELDQEVKRLEALASLTNEETEAVKSLLSDVVDSNQRRSLRQQFLMNFGFFVGGVVVTVIVATFV